MKIYGYIRLNTRRKQPKNFSLQRQEAIIRKYANEHELHLDEILSDLGSTSVSLNLPNLQKLMQMAEDKEIDALIIARLDRLTRSIRPMHQFIQKVCLKHKVRLISVEEGLDSASDSGQMTLNIIDIIAKWDSKMISDRTKELVERKRDMGERVGHAPFGFVYKNKKLVPFPKELKTVYLIREKRDSESLSYHKIAKLLNESRIPSKRGGRWYAETIKTIYENPLYNDTELMKLAKL